MAEILRSRIDLAHRNIVHPRLTRGEAQNDREIAHERAIRLAEYIQNNPLAMAILPSFFTYNDPILRTEMRTEFNR